MTRPLRGRFAHGPVAASAHPAAHLACPIPGNSTSHRQLAALVALALVLVVAVVPAAQAAARPKDPVVTAITAATSLTTGQRNQLRGQWAAASAAQARLEKRHLTARASALAAARGILTSLATAHALSAERLPAAMLDVRASTIQFGDTSRHFPAREERVDDIPGETAVFAYYPGTGLHLNPLFSFSKVAHLASGGDVDEATVLLARMEQLSVQRAGYRTWEYFFPWQGGKPGWTSAMADATAVQAMSRVSELTSDTHWIDLAHEVLPGFSIDARNGGLSTVIQGGRWFFIYPFNFDQRILNGHLQTLVGLGEYAKTTADPAVAQLVTDGVNGVLPMLSLFDTGAWSRYQIGQEADLGYHDLMIDQLHRLARATGQQAFADLEARFTLYRETPPTIAVPTQLLPTLYPQSQDGAFDVLHLAFTTDKRTTLRLHVVGPAGGAIRSLTVTQGRGTGVIDWDSRTDGHKVVPPGNYSLTWTATDIAGNSAEGAFPGPIVVATDTSAPRLLGTTVRALGPSKTRLVLRVSDVESAFVTARFGSGTAAVHGQGKAKVVLVVPLPIARVRAGSVQLVDTSGNISTIAIAAGSSPAPTPTERAAQSFVRAGLRHLALGVRFDGRAQRRTRRAPHARPAAAPAPTLQA